MISMHACLRTLFAPGPCRPLLTTAMVAFACTASLSASTFTVQVGTQSPISSSAPVGAASQNNSAYAGGSVGTNAFASAIAPFTLTNAVATGHAQATSTINDLVFTGPGPFIEFAWIIPYHGSLGYSVEGLGGGGFEVRSELLSSVFVTAQISCLGCPFFFNSTVELQLAAGSSPAVLHQGPGSSQTIGLEYEFTTPVTARDGGLTFSGTRSDRAYFVNGGFQTGVVTVPTGVPITVLLDLNTTTNATANYVASTVGFIDFSHTFGFPVDVPLFNLPEGYTANAPSIGLVDNIIPSASDVPEPGTTALAALGLAALHLYRCRRRGTTTRPAL